MQEISLNGVVQKDEQQPSNSQEGQNVPEPTKPQEPEAKPVVKAKKSKKPLLFVLTALAVISTVGFALYILFENGQIPMLQVLQQRQNEQQELAEEPTDVQNPIVTNENGENETLWQDYLNKEQEFLLMYPPKSKFVANSAFAEGLETYTITLAGEKQLNPITDEESLDDGYIFRFTIHADVLNKDLQQISIQKRNSYLSKCTAVSNISNIKDVVVAGIGAKTFEVTDCGSNYIETFFVRDNDLYQFTHIYNGDFGVKQVYKTAGEEILNKFALTNIIETSPKETWTTYTNNKYGFTFKYPAELNSTCCTIEGPMGGNSEEEIQKLIVLAVEDTIVKGTKDKFSGFGVFVDNNVEGLDFGTYLEKQKQLLRENYQIIVGKTPENVSEEVITVGNSTGVLLKGYAWWGDVTFVDVPGFGPADSGNSVKSAFIAISKTERVVDELSTFMPDVLDSFVFMR